MHDAPEQDRLRELVVEVNAGDAERIGGLVERLTADGAGLLGQIGDFVSRLGFVEEGMPAAGDVGPSALDVNVVGAENFVSLLMEHPAFSEDRRLDVGLSVFGDFDDPLLAGLRRDASQLLVTGAVALGVMEQLDERNFESLVRVSVGAEAFSTLLRGVLLRKPIPDGNIFDIIPGWLVDLVEDLERRTCMYGVVSVLTQYGRAISSAVGGRAATSWATGISSLSPNVYCWTGNVTINGSGFGNSQPADVVVLFPNRKGSCSEARVLSWSDTQIEVEPPSNVGYGCVGFARRSAGDLSALVQASSTLAGELERCVGMAVSGISYRLRKPPVALVSCPPCLERVW
jgi:hypothetical protein